MEWAVADDADRKILALFVFSSFLKTQKRLSWHWPTLDCCELHVPLRKRQVVGRKSPRMFVRKEHGFIFFLSDTRRKLNPRRLRPEKEIN